MYTSNWVGRLIRGSVLTSPWLYETRPTDLFDVREASDDFVRPESDRPRSAFFVACFASGFDGPLSDEPCGCRCFEGASGVMLWESTYGLGASDRFSGGEELSDVAISLLRIRGSKSGYRSATLAGPGRYVRVRAQSQSLIRLSSSKE
jgi:hypothetical protein